MPLSDILDNEAGSSVRTKLNSLIARYNTPVFSPWSGNVDAASFNLSNVGTLGVSSFTSTVDLAVGNFFSVAVSGISIGHGVTGLDIIPVAPSKVGDATHRFSEMYAETFYANSSIKIGSGAKDVGPVGSILGGASDPSADPGCDYAIYVNTATGALFLWFGGVWTLKG